MTLRVRADGEPWLADVGFGSGLLEPLPLDSGDGRRQGAWTIRAVRTGPGAWQLQERRGAAWAALYSVDEERQHAADVVMANHFSSTYPRSPFVNRLVVVRKDEDAIRRLLGRELSVTGPDWSVEQRELADGELADTLRDDFRLPLPAQDVAALVATLPRGAEAEAR